MADVEASKAGAGKYTGLVVDLLGLGKGRLSELLSEHGETSVYRADHSGVVVKMFDLSCGKPDEVSYGPYVAFNLEHENFQDIDAIPDLKRWVPAFYGANIDYERKIAYITMEYLAGERLNSWCQSLALDEANEESDQLRAAIHQTLAVVTRFHEHSIFLIDFKPDNVIRLPDGRIKFVDLGAFFTPRHSRETDKYVYSATPDYAELVIDTSNVQTGLPLNQCSDIFAAGVALFEMSTGRSRLAIADATCDQLLQLPEVYRFRDSQIRDVWHTYPHLQEVLPQVKTQLEQRQLLFAEVWHLIKGLLAHEVADWETLAEGQRQQLILETGTNLIADQLPTALHWLAEVIARATTLRSLRCKSMAELMRLVASPISEAVCQDLLTHNSLVQHVRDEGLSADFVRDLNTWEVRRRQTSGHWGILLPVAGAHFPDWAAFTFLKRIEQDPSGHSFYAIVSDLEADPDEGGVLTMARCQDDPMAWVGA